MQADRGTLVWRDENARCVCVCVCAVDGDNFSGNDPSQVYL
jgi:hypothetical protein